MIHWVSSCLDSSGPGHSQALLLHRKWNGKDRILYEYSLHDAKGIIIYLHETLETNKIF